MPAYGTLTPPPSIYQGDSYLCFNNETVPAGTKSERIAIGIVPGSINNSLSVEVVFGGTPGTFGVDLETSDSDVAADYVKLGSISSVSASNVGRLEQTPVAARFARLSMTTLGNSVSATAKITSH